MIDKRQFEDARIKACGYLQKAGIVLTGKERLEMEVADFGLGDLKNIGLEIIVYINTTRVCAKELVLFPGQTCPEHLHPSRNGVSGKEETFRCRWGKVYLYIAGEKTGDARLDGLEDYKEYLGAAHEVMLSPGEQYTLVPDTLHWFRAGAEGAVVSEFSTSSTDEQDLFTDPRINRFTKLG